MSKHPRIVPPMDKRMDRIESVVRGFVMMGFWRRLRWLALGR
jgi:hypothetical protein